MSVHNVVLVRPVRKLLCVSAAHVASQTDEGTKQGGQIEPSKL